MGKSRALSKLEDGSYFDRITEFIRYGETKPLNEDDKLIFERIEYTKNLLLQHKDQALVIQILRREDMFKGLKLAQLYNYVADAKALYALFELFNTSYELLIQKERIDRAFKLAEEWQDSKLYASAMDENRKWIEEMRKEQLRTVTDEDKPYTFVFHMDFTQIGVTHQEMDEWTAEVQEIKRKARLKFPNAQEITDVKYTQGGNELSQ